MMRALDTSQLEKGAQAVAAPARVVVFAFDSAEFSQIRRITRFISLGYDVHAYSMRRGDPSKPIETHFENTHLFWTEHQKLWKRVIKLAMGVVKTCLNGAHLRGANVIVVRNLDMMVIAWAARQILGVGKVPLVYECLDIHHTMTDPGWKGRTFRAVERWLLSRCNLLAVSSPGFLRAYFETVQNYHGPAVVWENLIIADKSLAQRSKIASVRADVPVLRLGWVGSIRCAPSLELMQHIARTLGREIEIHIHGQVHEHALPDFFNVLNAHDNIIYHGPYTYPGDLPAVYETFDLAWNIDLWMRGGNSDWCLSNRLYEAGWCGRASLALEGTEIARYVEEKKIGWVIPSADPTEVCEFLRSLDPRALAEISKDLLMQPESDFVSDGHELRESLDSLIRVQERRGT